MVPLTSASRPAPARSGTFSNVAFPLELHPGVGGVPAVRVDELDQARGDVDPGHRDRFGVCRVEGLPPVPIRLAMVNVVPSRGFPL